MHLAPKEILINAHVQLRPDLVTTDIVHTIQEIEERIKRVEPKVEKIFLEAAKPVG
jgi:divalent metal cation (Fe/Co/Zn/Cd) transporter